MMKVDLDKLITESRNNNTVDIDSVSTVEMLRMINNEDKIVAYAVEKELERIAEAVDIIHERLSKGGRLIYIGAGTSGRLGIVDASECPPTFGTDPELVQGIIAGGRNAVFKSVEGAEDNNNEGIADVKSVGLCEKDVLVGLAASGRTPYVIGALEYANEISAATVAVTCNPNSEMAQVAQISIAPVVGPEAITGSTRMKAGTAQKLVLNMLTTGVMVKLGKVYENLMVDVKASNIKLTERAKKIVSQCAGVEEAAAKKALEETDYDVKLAIFMIKSGLSKEDARKELDENKGFIKKALQNYL
ncbi:MAG TPA: N-acetylmuramic acid 6-phosphate etherase [Clostridia bacterium]|nr:N-acetylmuramic acid 6-phosphate etherase [Clostridia bacterium]